MPAKQTPRGRLWLRDGSCVRLRPERVHHVWSYDFVSATTHDGRTLRLPTLMDEYTRECLAIRVARRLGHYEVLEMLADVMLWRGIPEHIRADNGPELIATELRTWLTTLGARLFYSLKEAQIVIEQWRVQYYTRRPHSSLGYRPPAPEAYHPVISTNAIPQSLAVM